jgi:hypothetical protein
MGRPPQFPVKKVLGLDEGMVSRVDEWRRKQDPIPNFSDALRALVDNALIEAGVA